MSSSDINDNSSNYPCEKSKQWINAHRDLIYEAKCDRASFVLLIDEIENYSKSIKERRDLYKEIEIIWNDENVFEAIILDNGLIGFQMVERPF